MNHKRPPIPVIILVVLILLTAGVFGIRALLANGEEELTASGTIEAVEIIISPEISGRVVEVLVEEGDRVYTGQVLFRLDDTILKAQQSIAVSALDLARASLVTAQANYDVAVAAARVDAGDLYHADWRADNPPGYTLPGWYFEPGEDIQAAMIEVETASVARDEAQTALDNLLSDPDNVDFVNAERRVINARATFIVARDVLLQSNLAYDNTDLEPAAQEAYDAAEKELQDAQEVYDQLAVTDAGTAIRLARGVLAAASARYEAAELRLLATETGVYSPVVIAASAVVDQASKAVAQAEANRALIDAQITKLTVSAPLDGVVLSRSIQPGEIVTVGANALELGNLDALTITVFIPEDRYGVLQIGQSATVRVDSFPDEIFHATIIQISDQAEFTPRNVQTVEGRSSTVFAVKLRLENNHTQLKPGMPADVFFSQ